MINRSAIAVRPKQPFLDWLKSVEELEEKNLTLEQLDKTLYLVPDYEAPDDAEKVLKKVFDEIFCRELEAWYIDVDTWPKDRSLSVFRQWFDVEHFDLVEDMVAGPVGDDGDEDVSGYEDDDEDEDDEDEYDDGYDDEADDASGGKPL